MGSGVRSMRIAVFCPSWIGDAVMATPALRSLRGRYPGDHITGIMKPIVADVLGDGPWFDQLIPFDPNSRRPGCGMGSLWKRLRSDRYELAILLPNSFRSAALAWLAGIPRRVGYGRAGRSLLLTDPLRAPRDATGRRLPTPAVASYSQIARYLGCRIDSLRTELYTTAVDEHAADLVWSQLGLPRDSPVICLNTGGAFGPAKSWPAEHFATLARLLAVEAGSPVLVLCGPAERAAAREIAARAAHPRVANLADAGRPLGIGLTKACIRRSALLVTTDSGPRHFAAPFNVPVISLFGPTHIAWTRTYHPQAVHLFRPVPCGPCQQRACPLGHHRCMRELDPLDVYRVALRFLHPEPVRGQPRGVSPAG
jgi:heptosyltransferase-2